MAAPSSQTAADRPISYLLTDSTGAQTSYEFSIRPEELTDDQPNRQTVTQTLGGAWLDDFGQGVRSIQIRGHTGWRGGPGGDGVALFANLRSTIWDGWSKARATAVQNGLTPDTVQLVYADALDNITAVVAPGRFTLRRHRSRPLLFMFDIAMTVLSTTLGTQVTDSLSLTPTVSSAGGNLLTNGTDSLNGSISELSTIAQGSSDTLPAPLAAPAANLINVSNSAFTATVNAVSGSSGLLTSDANSLISISQALALAGRNGFYAIGAIPGLALDDMMAASQAASAFDNAFCVLSNAFVGVPQYPDYSQLYGASNCSSTVGGSPLSPLLSGNAFETLFPVSSGPVSVSPAAQANLTVMANADPVFAPMSMNDLAASFASIAAGVSIST